MGGGCEKRKKKRGAGHEVLFLFLLVFLLVFFPFSLRYVCFFFHSFVRIAIQTDRHRTHRVALGAPLYSGEGGVR